MSDAARPRPGRVFEGWYVVGAAFVILFAGFGTAYAFGAFFLPLSETFAATRAEVSAVFAYATSLIFVTGAASGHLADRLGPRPVVLAGLAAIAAGLWLAARADSLAAVTRCFAGGVGIGVGFCYVPAIGTVQRWFDRRRAFASGVAVTGIGLGTLTLPLVVGLLLAHGTWRSAFEMLALFVLALGLPALWFLDAEPARRGLHPDGASTPPRAAAGQGGAPGLLAVVRSRVFVQLYAAQLVLSFVVLVPFVHVVPYAVDAGVPRELAVTLLGLLGLGSTAGRIAVGGLADRLGRGRALVSLFAGLGGTYLLWLGVSSYAWLGAFALCYGTIYGGFIALMPARLADYFAGPRLGAIIGLQYTSAAFGALGGPIGAGYVFDVTGSYGAALALAAGLCVAAALLIATTPPPAR
ncbi:MAG: MFS transporter [Gammaproteobacteria bacterium]